MARAGAIIGCAAALLLGTVSGCTLDMTSLNLFAAATDREQVVSGSLETVSASSQKALHDLGVFVNVTKEGEVVRIASCTKDGKRFTLALNRVKGANGERTRARIEWEDQVDADFWFHFIETVATPKVSREGPPVEEHAWMER
jgi:hypothetical protein